MPSRRHSADADAGVGGGDSERWGKYILTLSLVGRVLARLRLRLINCEARGPDGYTCKCVTYMRVVSTQLGVRDMIQLLSQVTLL